MSGYKIIFPEKNHRIIIPDAIIINVPGSYSTIQAAINAANNGDIIQVAAGIYRENLTINKFIQLRGSKLYS
ncbi:MAG: hypothetical protein R2942_11690 [Ignavibacteria bacterium]